MSFAITPAGLATPAGPFSVFIQWSTQGAPLGEPNVAIVDFVGSYISATRGTGENSHIITVRFTPPVVSYTSWIYRYIADESMVTGVAVPQTGVLWIPPLEEMDALVALPMSGELDTILVTYGNALPEEMDALVALPMSGELDTILVTYGNALPEELDALVALPMSGELDVVLVTYGNALPEELDALVALPISGTLT